MRYAALLLVLAACVGCASSGNPIRDAGPRSDAAMGDAGIDGGSDAGTDDASVELDARVALDGGDASVEDDDAGLDAGASDGGAADGGLDAGIDAGGASDGGAIDGGPIAPPVVDGVIGATEWATATSATETTTTAWTGSELRGLRAILTADSLYVAIEGTVEGGNGIVVYVDRARSAAEGVVLSTLTDSSGALDDAMTAGFTTPADFRADLGWGTLDLGRAATASDARMGWRDFIRATSPGDLYWIDAAIAPTTCSATACETRLPRSVLDMGSGVARPRTISIFARIVNPDGTMSPNQTLPMDVAAAPRTVSVVLSLTDL